jgi:predicted DNA-binding transcriptional regulator YafY
VPGSGESQIRRPKLGLMLEETNQPNFNYGSTKFARMIRLMSEVKTNPYQRPEELWRLLGIKRSQFFEDRKALAQFGFEFKYDRREKRYRIVRDIFIPVLDLTVTEVISLAMAVRQLSAAGDHTLVWDAVQAIRKIAANAPEAASEMLSYAINQKTLKDTFKVSPKWMNLLWQAQQNRHRTRILYDDYSRGQKRWLLADIYMIYFKGRALYVDAYLPGEDRIAMLRASRVKQVELLSEEFQVHPDYNFHERHRYSFRVMIREGSPVRVRIRFDPKIAPYIREAYWHDSQQILGCDDGGLILSLTVAEPQEVLWYLVFPWGEGAEILEPESLRREAARIALQVYKRYTEKKDPGSK